MKPTKYTRTYHAPWSLGVQSDDKMLKSMDHFIGSEVFVWEKLDGENTSLYSKNSGGILHARSIDSRHNETRDWVKKMHSVIQHDIPDDMKLIGENLFAEHSIRYNDLESYFYLFAIWQQREQGVFSLSYNDVMDWANLLDLATPKLLYKGIYNEKLLIDLANSLDLTTTEGYVIRKTNEFNILDTDKNIAKFVREGHVQTDEHWLKNWKQNGALGDLVKPYFMK